MQPRRALRPSAGRKIPDHHPRRPVPAATVQRPPRQQVRARRIGFLLLRDYSMIALASAVEPLRMANLLSGVDHYCWLILTLDGQPLPASNGMVMQPDNSLTAETGLDALFVCGGVFVEQAWSDRLREPLHNLARQNVALGSLCTGTYVLARAGVLNGYRCTIHWENASSLREAFPHIIVSPELFEIDRDRYTCSGGTAPLDMMLNLIARDCGGELAIAISEEFLCERIRGPRDRQRMPLRLRPGGTQPVLTEAVALMEANVEEPLSIDELAVHVGVSRRQLERLFRKYLETVPTRYYLDLRLRRARELLLQTCMSIGQIAAACGFASTQHFSTCFRQAFGLSPRLQRRQAWLSRGQKQDTPAGEPGH